MSSAGVTAADRVKVTVTSARMTPWGVSAGSSTRAMRPGRGPDTTGCISRRKRGMYDKFIARDLDADGDTDFVGTRGNSAPYDGVYWLEQVRSSTPRPAFERARTEDSPEMPLP